MKTLKLITAFLGLFLFTQQAQTQDAQFSVATSSDTVLMGNYFEVRFTVENTNGQFIAPDFRHFTIVGGPNTSTSMSIINGVTSQSSTYTYFLQAEKEGLLEIGPAQIKTEEANLETPPLEIFIKENPEGLVKDPKGFSSPLYGIPKEKKKENKLKKYKAKKI